MKLSEFIKSNEIAKDDWEGEYKIPWHEPQFSKRMLQEHLSQNHDMASRRLSIIEAQVRWINETLLNKKKSIISDICCGPGFYTERLAALGHSCLGIDFSPASIEYAIINMSEKYNCEYLLGDVLETDYGTDRDLVTMIFGEFNVFSPDKAISILKKAYDSLKPGGQILIEVQIFDAVKAGGNSPASWYKAEQGLFSDNPHLCLISNRWNEEKQITTNEFVVIDSTTEEISKYSSCTKAYSNDELYSMFKESGFSEIEFDRDKEVSGFDNENLQIVTAMK